MPAKAKIAVSLSPEVLHLVDRNANGRSRSQCIEQELLRALRAREWERFSAQILPEGNGNEVEWAEAGFAAAHDALAREEGSRGRRPAKRRRAR